MNALDRLALWAALAFPAYVAFQLVPLPLFILRILDPARAEMADALHVFLPAQNFAPFTITPPTTWVQLSRITGCAVVFLVMRAFARAFARRPWWSVIPLLALGAMEAAIGLAQYSVGAPSVTGTYYSRDHYAGLLEMILPFAATYGIAVLYRGAERGVLVAQSVVKASGLLVVAAAMLGAITLSLSKMGFVSTLGCLFIMGILSVRAQFSGVKGWAAAICLAALVVLIFIFLPPGELVARFGGVTSDGTAEGRWPIAKDTLRMISAYPLFGVGLGTYYPGLLRFQSYGLGFAWMNAHNDFLQLLSELGIIGFLIPSALLFTVLARAVQAVKNSTREVGLLALGCVGGLSALLIHSLSDFNTYIPANAIILAWISGISASLPLPAEQQPRPRSESRRSPALRAVMFALAGCCIVYAAGWLIFLLSFRGDAAAERKFCGFGICDSVQAMSTFLRQYGGDAATIPPGELAELLRRDPGAPGHWQDLGESLQSAGRIKEARFCFATAMMFAPRIPKVLLRAAHFHFGLREENMAFDLIVRALEGDPEVDDAAYDEYEEQKIPVEEVLRQGLPPDLKVWRTYLHRQIIRDRSIDAITVWSALVSRGYADDQTANELAGFLIGKKQPEAAVHSWALYAGNRSAGYPDSNRVFNGDFESDSSGSPFDWRIEPRPGAAVSFDRDAPHAGARSARIQFDGTQNLASVGLSETVFLNPGRYRFRAYVRAKDISTDEGVFFTGTSQDGPGVSFTTASVLGSTVGSGGWKLVEHSFAVSTGARMVQMGLGRKPSLKFDDKIGGTLWIDQVSIRPESER